MSCPGSGQPIGLLLGLTYTCSGVDTTGQTVLSNKKASGPYFSKKQWRELLALIAAEKAAAAKAETMPQGPEQRELLAAAEAASELRGLLADPLGPDHDFPSERIELLTGALDFAVAATETSRALIWASRAIEIAEMAAAKFSRDDETDVERLLEWLL
jgi:hypothetical protein